MFSLGHRLGLDFLHSVLERPLDRLWAISTELVLWPEVLSLSTGLGTLYYISDARPPKLLLRVDLLIHLGKPVLDNFYDPFCLLSRRNIEF